LKATDPALVSLSKLLDENFDKVFCISPKGKITRRELLAHALSLSKQLPEKTYAVNLCQDRYLFIVAYLAVVLRQQISLLPPNQSSRTLDGLLTSYQDSFYITDEWCGPQIEQHASTNSMSSKAQNCFLISWDRLKLDLGDSPLIDVDRTISISFTSGSTGNPKAIEKSWREFQLGAELATKHLSLQKSEITLVSTVPSQHMYGLETSLFWPLFSSLSIYDGRPFYPEDIAHHLKLLGCRAGLVSTPAHLKACVKVATLWPAIDLLLSSTAPMAAVLAHKVENTFNAPLFELFGSTETLSFATRQTAKSPRWQCYHGIQVSELAHRFVVAGGHLPCPVYLDDSFILHEDHSFSILGRSEDLIKIAGKRASLAELNLVLNHIDGIEDGVFIHSKNERLAAIVVSDLAKKTILAELKQSMDAVFLPRKIYFVAELPRNSTGKINKIELQDLLQGLSIV
jgi:acyl-coenzyme A synthetase/AMP-(fatty) acid ligase